ncbi:hypothetical protein LX36DRAFT_716115 [Colletotrichum falcatum]|nr:hypothetical protein LX36DRAFT_716115 [Colletotrichum falcatum]
MVLFLVSQALPPPPNRPPSPLTSYKIFIRRDPFGEEALTKSLFSTSSSLHDDCFPNNRSPSPQRALEVPPFPPATATFFLLQAIFFHYARVAYVSSQTFSASSTVTHFYSPINPRACFSSSPYTAQRKLIEGLGFPIHIEPSCLICVLS